MYGKCGSEENERNTQREWLQQGCDVMRERVFRSARNYIECRKDEMSVYEARRVCGDQESLIYYVYCSPLMEK